MRNFRRRFDSNSKVSSRDPRRSVAAQTRTCASSLGACPRALLAIQRRTDLTRPLCRIRPPLAHLSLDSSSPASLLAPPRRDVDDLTCTPYECDYENESICAGGTWFTFGPYSLLALPFVRKLIVGASRWRIPSFDDFG